ncbi:lactosylceramide alpha-2%2C3-sialyltransferase [Scomber scombrus]|uniref:Lactosylceramide alpha-2,3-sialyltransferase n=1 Tax=Scomber scombrus TaxID=13677 RepID=A0AAV1PGN2_SCOSC
MVSLAQLGAEKSSPVEWHVDAEHKKRVHEHVRRVLTGQCHPGSTRQSLMARLPTSSHLTQPFLWRDVPLTEDLFQYPPPFGFKGLQGKVENLLKQLPDSAAQMEKSKECRRCVVMGNGGILKGLELGQLIDKFDIIIRLNSGPLGEFSVDVGNRTSIRMSYPEGTPLQWVDTDSQTLFVAVVHKGGDISWTSAMINKHNTVPLWDRLFFWQKVPDQIPLEPERFRLLNPHVIRETALDLLKYLPPTQRLLGWDKFCCLSLSTECADPGRLRTESRQSAVRRGQPGRLRLQPLPAGGASALLRPPDHERHVASENARRGQRDPAPAKPCQRRNHQ